jgi:hypothetical protein
VVATIPAGDAAGGENDRHPCAATARARDRSVIFQEYFPHGFPERTLPSCDEQLAAPDAAMDRHRHGEAETDWLQCKTR